VLVRVIDGKLRLNQRIRLWANGQQFDVEGLGYQSPKAIPSQELVAGEVGYIYATSKMWPTRTIGDTITDAENPALSPCPVSRKSSQWFSPASIRSNRTSTVCSATR